MCTGHIVQNLIFNQKFLYLIEVIEKFLKSFALLPRLYAVSTG